MSIEIISLTSKGEALSHSIRHSNYIGWNVIFFIRKLGGRVDKSKIINNIFNGNQSSANAVLRDLKMKGIIVGE